jgi:adenine C2-methylase RlmN of 23S rRNA A2503 and tRNA A37
MMQDTEKYQFGSLVKISEKPYEGGISYLFQTSAGVPVYTKTRLAYDARENIRKWKVGPSITSGCPVGCLYCYTRDIKEFHLLSYENIIDQVRYVYEHPFGGYDVFKIDLKTMGDPLINPHNTLKAVEEFCRLFPKSHISVSTSGPKDLRFSNPQEFFSDLRDTRDAYHGGNSIKLQFSCHSTSNEDRKKLHPCMPLLSLEEIAEVSDYWYTGEEDSRVTLTFVPFLGYSLEASALREIFDPRKVFVKISYLDTNRFTIENGLVDEDPKKVRKFIGEIEAQGFQCAYRGGK